MLTTRLLAAGLAIEALTRDLARRRAVVLVTHRPEPVARVADRWVRLATRDGAGTVAGLGTREVSPGG